MKQTLLNIYFQFFWFLARNYINKCNPFVIWITGSIGKTSCRMIVSEILQKNLKDKIIYTSNKNFNGELGMSLSILGISDYEPNIMSIIKTIIKAIQISFYWKKLYDIIVLEYGIDHIWEMDFLLSIVKPDIWIITKIDRVHALQFWNQENTAKEKYKLLQQSKKISFLNFDDEYASIYEKEILWNTFYYTTNNTLIDEKIDLLWLNYDLKYENNTIKSTFDFYCKHTKNIPGELIWKNKRVDFRVNITSNLIWEENVWYISIWFHILDFLFQKYYRKSYFVVWVEKINIYFTLQYSRFGLLEWIHDSILIDSSYNAAPESMKKVIDNFWKVSKKIFPEYEVILCLWEMRELWDYTKVEHENLAHYLKDRTENIFVVWKSMEKYFLPMVEKAKYFKNSQILWEYLKDFISNSDKKHLILFKWSQNTIFMEEALKPILKNPEDMSKICRQENFWIEKKNKFFES